ncbi:MAG: STAS domain-containing protein [Planctomycetota bacterium]|jgi:anti-sigma B factor antagonist
MSEGMTVEISEEGQAAVISFKSATICNSDEIASASEEIKEYIGEKKPSKMVFDFGNVKFFSSQVLGMLLDIRSKTQEYDGDIVISSINPQLHRVFKITSLDNVFEFFPDKESAVKEVT